MSELDTAALRKLLAETEGFHPLQGSPMSLLMAALPALLDEVERLREHHEKSIEVGLHLADDSNHWVKVADKLEARIDATLVDCDCAIADYHDDSMGAYGTMADRLLGALQSARAALAGADNE